MTDHVDMSCFSDVLCVWSYVSGIRLDELRDKLGDKIRISYHFITLFGCTKRRIGEGWKDRGGYEGFSDYVTHVGEEFPHVAIHPDVWRTTRPRSSAGTHLFLKAVQLLQERGEVPGSRQAGHRNTFEELLWQTRCAFFRDCRDIGSRSVMYELAEGMQLPLDRIQAVIDDGTAFGALFCDTEMREKHRLEGSPTYLLNDGRQKLYGNVGYRILQANIEELLQRPKGMASWC